MGGPLGLDQILIHAWTRCLASWATLKWHTPKTKPGSEYGGLTRVLDMCDPPRVEAEKRNRHACALGVAGVHQAAQLLLKAVSEQAVVDARHAQHADAHHTKGGVEIYASAARRAQSQLWTQF